MEELENHQNKCRLCLSSLELSDDNVMISTEIEAKFSALIGIELRSIEELSNTACGYCDRKLIEFCNFQQRLFDVQTKLYQFLVDSGDHKQHWSQFVGVEDGNLDQADMKTEAKSEDEFLESPQHEQEEYLEETEDQTYFDSPAPWKKLQQQKEVSMEESQANESDDDWNSPLPENSWRPKICKYCGETLTSNTIYRKHLKEHRAEGLQKMSDTDYGQGQTVCPICAKVLRRGSIPVHLLTVHGINPTGRTYFCDHCKYKSIRKRALVLHMGVHREHDPKKYKCKYCTEAFAKPTARRHHERRIHEEPGKIFQCECGKTFTSSSGLYFHRKEVHEPGEFACSFCKDTFTSKIKLKNHTDRLHEPKKICDICGKSVPPGSLFLKHMQRHGPRVECPHQGCTKNFTVRSSLLDHIKSEHQPHKNLHCPTCNAVFSTDKKLRIHIKRQHETVSVSCEVEGCRYSSTRRSNMVAHYRAHTGLSAEYLENVFRVLKSIKMAG